MKLLKYSLALLPFTSMSLSAAVITFDGLSFEQPIQVLSGWSTSEANPSSAPLAWAEPIAGNMAAAIGGAYSEAVNPSFSATLSSSIYSSVASVSLDVMLRTSTPSASGRDTFTVGLASATGGALLDIVFSPSVTVDGVATWEVGYGVSGGDINYTGFVFNEDAWYDVSMGLNGSNFTLTFANTVDSITSTGTIAGFDGETDGIGNVSFGWKKASTTPYGDNYMLFDNVAVIPEPSAALLGGLASLMLLRRRR